MVPFGGTGRAHCERFADEGADVIALDIPAAAMSYVMLQGKSKTVVDVARRASPTPATSQP